VSPVETDDEGKQCKQGEKKMGNTKTLQPHLVCQAFCSALPVAYCKSIKSSDFAEFGSLVLDAAYEATLLSALLLARKRRERVKVFLTCLGGGAFGNRREWIKNAIVRSLKLFREWPLDVRLVHYGYVAGFYEDVGRICSIAESLPLSESAAFKLGDAPQKQRKQQDRDDKRITTTTTTTTTTTKTKKKTTGTNKPGLESH